MSKLDADAQMRKDYEEAKRRAAGAGGMFWKAEEGENVVRILPPWKEGENFYRKIGVHFGAAAANEAIGVYCPKVNAGAACPVCEQAEELMEKGRRDDYKRARQLQPRTSYYSNVLIMSTPSGEGEGSVKVYRYGTTVFTGILDIVMTGKWGKIHDEKTGRALTIKRTGTEKDDTDYTVIPEPESGPLDKVVMKNLHNLDDDAGVIETWTADEIKMLMEGEDPNDVRAKRGGKGEKAAEPRGKKGAEDRTPAAERSVAAPVDKKLLKRVIGAAVDESIDLDKEDPADLLAEFKEKIEGKKVKQLEDATRELLEELGADVSGKLVEWPAPEAAPKTDETEAQDDDSDIKAQMQKLRDQREAKGKGKK